jgi:hypothetical protein
MPPSSSSLFGQLLSSWLGFSRGQRAGGYTLVEESSTDKALTHVAITATTQNVAHYLALSGITNGVVYGTYGRKFGELLQRLCGWDRTIIPNVTNALTLFAAAAFGMNNVDRGVTRLLSKPIAKGTKSRRALHVGANILSVLSALPFTGMAMEAFETLGSSGASLVTLVIWHSINRWLMNYNALHALADKICDYIVMRRSDSTSTGGIDRKQLRDRVLGIIQQIESASDGNIRQLAENVNKPDDGSTARITALLQFSSGAVPASQAADASSQSLSKRQIKIKNGAGVFGGVCGALTACYLKPFAMKAIPPVLHILHVPDPHQIWAESCADTGILATAALWGIDAGELMAKLVTEITTASDEGGRLLPAATIIPENRNETQASITAQKIIYYFALLLASFTAAGSEAKMVFDNTGNWLIRIACIPCHLCVYPTNTLELFDGWVAAIKARLQAKDLSVQAKENLLRTTDNLLTLIAQLPEEELQPINNALVASP